MASLDQFSFEPCQSLRQRTLISSIGGFSQPAAKQIRSLQELLRAIQPLLLRLYDGSELQEDCALGEGVSYNVFRCRDVARKTVVAIKQVKMPSSTTDFESFQIRVSCVLKDIEVMHHPPLAAHPNIINLLGYGWKLQKGSIPFLVMECATLRTLRQYLKVTPMSARQQQKFCRHVALGLHELHMSGIAHGDVKLDNVLVVLQSPQSPEEAERVDEDGEDLVPVAKISDFGHALLLSDDQGGDADQRYRGTKAYNAPELFGAGTNHQGNWTSIDFRRCDVWAYGLLCLEVLGSGTAYYGNQRVRDGLSRSSVGSGSLTLVASSSDSQDDLLAALRPWICDIALNLAKRIPSRFTSMNFIRTFRLCLANIPNERVYDVSTLPILAYGANKELPSVRPRLNESSEKLSQWLFESFRPRQIAEIPHIAKSQIFSDSQRLAATQSSSASRAAFQAGLAYATGFGTPKNQAQFLAFMSSSAALGHPISRALSSFFANDFCKVGVDQPKVYSKALAFAFKQSQELVNRRESRIEHNRMSQLNPTASNTAPVLNPEAAADAADSGPLAAAARLGSASTISSLLRQGADPRARFSDGSNMFHWLFLLPVEKMRDVVDIVIEMIPKTDIHELLRQVPTTGHNLDSQFPLELRGTPLSYAVATASEEAVDLLLELGADPNLSNDQTSRHHSPLWFAASLHQSKILQRLLTWTRLGVAVPADSQLEILGTLSESSPLERELIHGNNSVASCRDTVHVITRSVLGISRFLGDENFRVHTVRALEVALSAGDLVVVEAIFDACKSAVEDGIQATLQLGRIAILRTALQTACRDIYDRDVSLSLISFALLQGSDVNTTDPMYQDVPPIFIPIEYQREELFRFLFERGADLKAKDNQGRCSVHLFAIHGFFKSFPIEKIDELCISLDVEDSQGRTPLHYAAKSGMLKQTQLLLQHGVNADHVDFAGDEAIHHAVRSKAVRIVESVLLYQKPEHINSRNKSLMTPLAIAAKDGLHDIVKILLANGADPFKASKDGKLPIHHAAENRRPMVVEELLKPRPGQSGEQITSLLAAKTTAQLSALDLAIGGLVRESDDRTTCDILLTAGANATHSLVCATKRNQIWLVKYLLGYNPDLTYNDQLDDGDASSALTSATLRGNIDLVELLLSHAADCNKLDGNGENAIHCAILKQDFKILDKFLANKQAPEVNRPDREGSKPLDLALSTSESGSKSVAVGICYQLLWAGASYPVKPWPRWFSRCDLEFLQSLYSLPKYLDSEKSLAIAHDFVRKGIHSGGALGTQTLNALHVWATLPEICALSWWSNSPHANAIKKAIACVVDSATDDMSLDNAGRTPLSRAVYANNTVMCGSLLRQFKVGAEGAANAKAWSSNATESSKPIKPRYKEEVEESWINVVQNQKWEMVEVFVSVGIDLEMTALNIYLQDFFLRMLLQDVGPVLRMFAEKPKTTVQESSPTKATYYYPQPSPREIPRQSMIPKWLKWKKQPTTVPDEEHKAVEETVSAERVSRSENSKVALHRFWLNDIVDVDFPVIEKLVPDSALHRIAILIIKNGLVMKIDRMKTELDNLMRNSWSKTKTVTMREFSGTRQVHNAIDKSISLCSDVKRLTSLTYVSQIDRAEPVVSFGRLLSIQTQIQFAQIEGAPPPPQVEGLRSGLDLLEIRTNECVNFIRDVAQTSPAVAMSYGFTAITYLQGIRLSSSTWAQASAVETTKLPPGLDVYSVLQPEIEKILGALVTISLVTVKSSASIYERGWLHVFSSVKFAAASRIKFPYTANFVTNAPPVVPHSYELDPYLFSTSRTTTVEVLLPSGRWWLAKDALGSIGFIGSEKLTIKVGPIL